MKPIDFLCFLWYNIGVKKMGDISKRRKVQTMTIREEHYSRRWGNPSTHCDEIRDADLKDIEKWLQESDQWYDDLVDELLIRASLDQDCDQALKEGESIELWITAACKILNVDPWPSDDEPSFIWYLVEDCTKTKAAIYRTPLNADKEIEALKEGNAIFKALSDYDKKQRGDVYICQAALSDNEIYDPNTERYFHFIKRED